MLNKTRLLEAINLAANKNALTALCVENSDAIYDDLELQDAVNEREGWFLECDADLMFSAPAVASEAAYVPSERKLREGATAIASAVAAVAAPASPLTAPKPSAALRRYARTEFGNTDRMLDRFGADIMFVEDLAQWYAWNGTCWERSTEDAIRDLANKTVRALPEDAKHIADDEDRQKYLEFAARSQKASMVKNMELLARSDAKVRVKTSDLDKELSFLGVENGAVDLRTGALLAADRAMRLTTHAAAAYDPAATCPVWEDTLKGVFAGDMAMVAFFKRLMGYTLLGSPREDVIVIPFGNGSNGKSTVLGTIRKVFGGYARTASAATFLEDGKNSNAGGPREDVLRLRGARFVYVGEPDENSVLREGFVKTMTGGDPMPARGVNAKATVEVIPTWVPVMPTNHRPIIKGDDYAIWRRIMTVPFLVKFDKERQASDGGADINREERLIAEADGILTWLVEGALEYQRMGLGVPEPVKAAKDAYKEDMDLLRDWLEECSDADPGAFATNDELWGSWQAFALAKGELKFIASSRALGHRLANRFKGDTIRINGKKTRGYWGLRIRGVRPAASAAVAADQAQRKLEECTA